MPGNGAPLIQLQGVKKVFYTDEVETHALADVHLEIRQGEYVCMAGPSGCGKTTLLSLLGLLDTPSEGSYLLETRPVANLTPPSGRAFGTGGSASSSRPSTSSAT